MKKIILVLMLMFSVVAFAKDSKPIDIPDLEIVK